MSVGHLSVSAAAVSVIQHSSRLQDPHPALRMLCQLDAAGLLATLRQALAGWDALETGARDTDSSACLDVGLHGSRNWVLLPVDSFLLHCRSGRGVTRDCQPDCARRCHAHGGAGGAASLSCGHAAVAM